MFKIMSTLIRGRIADAEEEFADRHALPLLDQQIRDAAAGVTRSQKALALAIAQDEGEARRQRLLEARIADLEERAVAALQGGRDDLAREAAAAIAEAEADRDAIREARASVAGEIERLRRAVAEAGRRLAALERGRRLAQAAEAVRRLKSGAASPFPVHDNALAEAEATLRRLRERQAEAASADAALATLQGAGPADVADKLESEGFGRRTRPTAESVLARLKERAAPPAAPAA